MVTVIQKIIQTTSLLLLIVVSLSLCSCGGWTDVPIARVTVDPKIVIVDKNSPEIERAVQVVSDNMIYFKKDDKCFAVVFSRSFGILGIASLTEVSSCPK
jgi:hypothetical protein